MQLELINLKIVSEMEIMSFVFIKESGHRGRCSSNFMYKKILISLLFFSFCLGCSRHERADFQWHHHNGKLKVLTTIAMINDLVAKIGGEEVDTISLIRGELDPHSYELVKGDDEKFARADLIFYNGLGLEHGLSLRQNLENNPKAIAVADALLSIPGQVLQVDGQYDPHVWMDVALWVQTIDPIIKALCEKDPTHSVAYQQRGEALKATLRDADEKIFSTLQAIDEKKRYLVTGHDAFHYFTRHYLAAKQDEEWQIRCKAPEGLAPESQMSVSDVIEIISHIETYQIGVLFPESNVSKDSLRKILTACQEKGFKIHLCQDALYSDSMGEAFNYLEMIHHNVRIIARELQGN